jgi:hypothetical protein
MQRGDADRPAILECAEVSGEGGATGGERAPAPPPMLPTAMFD